MTLNRNSKLTECALCGANTSIHFQSSFQGRNGSFNSFYRCKKCGFIFRNYGQQENSLLPQDLLRARPRAISMERMVMLQSLQEKIRPYRKLNRVLDVGSGDGTFLDVCYKSEWQVTGVEPYPQNAGLSKARQRRLNIFPVSLPDANFPANWFDAVALINVLEHIPSPQKFFTEIRRVLRPGGVVLIRTPNAGLHLRLRSTMLLLARVVPKLYRVDRFALYHSGFTRSSLIVFFRLLDLIPLTIYGDSSFQYEKRRHFLRWISALLAQFEKVNKGRFIMRPSLVALARKPSI